MELIPPSSTIQVNFWVEDPVMSFRKGGLQVGRNLQEEENSRTDVWQRKVLPHGSNTDLYSKRGGSAGITIQWHIKAVVPSF